MVLSIVVDTDVVRSARHGSKKEQAKEAAEVLAAILEGRFLLAISEELREEWFKKRACTHGQWDLYISVHATQWYIEMLSRRRVRTVKIDKNIGKAILAHIPQNLRQRAEALKKDLPVILTALAADRRLISNNRRERNTLAEACDNIKQILAGLLWPYPLDVAAA